MNSAQFVKFRDIPSPVLEIIKSTRRGEDMSELVNWGQETGYLSQAGRVTTLNLICDMCGAEMHKHLYEARKALKQGSQDAYCSKKCCSAHHATKNSQCCRWCRTVPTSAHARYCSQGCKESAAKARRMMRLAMRPTKFCIRCGKEYAGSGAAYCSLKCSNAAHSLQMIGAGNSKFRGLGKYSNQFSEMRCVIMERDEARCAACYAKEVVRGNRRKKSSLETHHIDMNTRNNHPDNLIMLCIPCHRKHHNGTLGVSPLFSLMATERTLSMTSKLKDRATFLLKVFSSTTAL